MIDSNKDLQSSISMVLGGAAGQGIQALENILSQVFRLDGYHVFAGKEYMSRVRGGSNSTLIRVSSQKVRAWTDCIDLFIPLDGDALLHMKKRIQPKTLIIGDQATLKADGPLVDVPIAKMAAEIGGIIYSNVLAAGILSGIFEVNLEILEKYIQKYFGEKPPDLIEKNLMAAKRGYEAGVELRKSKKVSLSMTKPPAASIQPFISGSEAVGLGAIAGGCTFVSSYPMSPGTGTFAFLAKQSREFGIAVEQAEDEMCAANMILGAWYAGARGFASTSGGGFALMSEAISLAGMIETPMVVHLAQRPGPATGLPTRTEQGDLNLALYAGHGDFSRIILAPGNLEQAFQLTKLAFQQADTYQVPVILLTDQYLMDCFYDIDELDFSNIPSEPSWVKTAPDYRRYAITETGISPRGIPGWGEGFVGVDSDEHDEEGHITENLELRVGMVEKRLRKMNFVKKNALLPDWYGPENCRNSIVCWGSTLEMVREAVLAFSLKDTAVLHFSQIFPLPDETKILLNRAKNRILIEGNATGQFGRLLKQEFGVECEHQIFKFNGLPFSVEELGTSIQKALILEEQ
jgi:2-oxoglutarate ferredoxin oxidoreductase subunit alpha